MGFLECYHIFSFGFCAQAQNDSVIQIIETFSYLDFIPKPVSPESEVIPETEDSITTEKLKAGVHSYLKQNAEKVRLNRTTP